MAGLSTFQSGPKGTKIVNPSVFDHFLPFWALLDSFRLFQTKIAFLLLSTSAKPEINIKNLLYPFGAKKSFLSEMVQRGPEGPKRIRNGQKHLGWPFWPFWTTLGHWQACHVWPVLVQNGTFLGRPQSWTVDPKVKKRLITRSSFLPLSCHRWQVMGPKEVLYSYLVPGMIGQKFHENWMFASVKTKLPSLLWPAEWKVPVPFEKVKIPG